MAKVDKDVLLSACETGSLDKILKYKGLNLQVRYKDYWLGPNFTSLHIAAGYGHLPLVQFLINYGQCDAMCTDDHGRTPLHQACWMGKLEVAKYLIQQAGCRTDCKDNFGQTPLHRACLGREPEVAKYLIEEAGCRTDCKDNLGRTPLHLACREGKLKVVKYLIQQAGCRTYCEDNLGQTPLHRACRAGGLEVAKYLIQQAGCRTDCKDNHGWTPLHHACSPSAIFINPNVADYLLRDAHADPNATTNDGRTPLDMSYSSSIIELLIKYGAKPDYEKWSKYTFLSFQEHHLAQNTTKSFVLGNPGAGKSSLTNSLQIESKGLSTLVNRFFQMTGVSVKTAGIVPHDMHSKKFGHVTLFDFAGQKEFYAGHDALLRNAMEGSQSAIFFIVVDLRDDDGNFKSTLLYWIGFIENQYTSDDLKPHLIIVGSHADRVKAEDVRRKQALMKSLEDDGTFEKFQRAGDLFYTLDCRYAESSSLTKLRSTFADVCKSLQRSQDTSFQNHWYLVYLLDKFGHCNAVRLGEVVARSTEELKHSPNLQTVVESCELLSAHGNLLFLKNQQCLENSWIILKKPALLSRVNGSIFAPEGFQEHLQIATITGVVLFSKLASQFSDLDPDMIAQLLCHLEFCHEVTDGEVLSLLQAGDISSSPKERFFFFPGLVCLGVPKDVWEPSDRFSYHTGWVLQCLKPEQFFTPRFLQVLILRLIFTFGLELTTPSRRDIPALERRCSVWKNGISWSDHSGLRVLVEVSEQKCVILLLSCHSKNQMALVGVRSTLIKKILSLKKEFCPKVVVEESFLPSQDAVHFPLDMSSIKPVSLTEISKPIVEGSQFAVRGTTEHVDIEELLLFEPYSDLGPFLLRELFDKEQPNYQEEIKDEFLYRLADKAVTKTNSFIKLFEVSLSRLDNLVDMAPKGDTHKFVRVFQLWRDSQEEGSRSDLCHRFNQFSVFAGRNPFDLISSTH